MDGNDEFKKWIARRAAETIHWNLNSGDENSDSSNEDYTEEMVSVAGIAASHQEMIALSQVKTNSGLNRQHHDIIQNQISSLSNELNNLKQRLTERNLTPSDFEECKLKIEVYKEKLGELEETFHKYRTTGELPKFQENQLVYHTREKSKNNEEFYLKEIIQLKSTININSSPFTTHSETKRANRMIKPHKMKVHHNKVVRLNKTKQTENEKRKYLQGFKNMSILANQKDVGNEVLQKTNHEVTQTAAVNVEQQKEIDVANKEINELEEQLSKLKVQNETQLTQNNCNSDIKNNYDQYKSEAMDCVQGILPDLLTKFF